MNYDEMYPWEIEEAFDLRCIHLDAELEERARIELEEEEDDGYE